MSTSSARHLTLYLAAVLAFASGSACTGRHAPRARPAYGSFSVHEWGLIAADIRAPTRIDVASGSQHPHPHFGHGGGGGAGYKPVVYVHLAPGVRQARFSLVVGVGGDHVPEHFPVASLDAASLRFGPIVARLGACDAARLTPVPTADSAACQTPDGFCEAAEIPRYTGERDVCLTTHGQTSELLFYRARGLDVASLPLTLARTDDAYVIQRAANAVVAGPVLFITNFASGPTLRVLDASVPSGQIDPTARTISSSEARTLLADYARSLGLGRQEADAMIDAWAPAIFETCQRTGPEAAGTPPESLVQADTSLLYFAPRAVVDAMLPLSTTPAADAIERAFLVRVADGARPTETPRSGSGFGDSTRATVRPAGTASARGGLTRDQIRRVVLRNISQLRSCYELGLRVDPDLKGRLSIAFTINVQGQVMEAHVDGSTVGQSNVGSCTESVFRRWNFPSSDPASGPTVGSFPFDFTDDPDE